ncbi:gp53-like domain-containing protein, partial [Citrobacter amalonaticus]
GLGAGAKLGAASATAATSGRISIPALVNGVERNIIFQWATPVLTGAATSGTVSFPVAFPTACLIVIPVDAVSGGGLGTLNLAWNIATTTRSALGWAATVAGEYVGAFVYLAIGY